MEFFGLPIGESEPAGDLNSRALLHAVQQGPFFWLERGGLPLVWVLKSRPHSGNAGGQPMALHAPWRGIGLDEPWGNPSSSTPDAESRLGDDSWRQVFGLP